MKIVFTILKNGRLSLGIAFSNSVRNLPAFSRLFVKVTVKIQDTRAIILNVLCYMCEMRSVLSMEEHGLRYAGLK
jgi:hypothetical protein